MNGAHGLGVQPCTLVGQVVARDPGDRRVAQTHRLDALRDPAWLVAVEFGRLPGVDLAEVAATRALLTADQECRLTVFPALVDVGAPGLFADRVQPFTFHETFEFGVLRAHRRARLDPLGFALDRSLRVADLEAQQLAAVGCGGGWGL